MRSEARVYRFGPYVLNAEKARLSRDGEQIFLQDRQMDVLMILVAHAGRIVSKDALVERAWRGVSVGDDSVFQTISRLRDALGRQPDGSSYIETVVRKGYRFTAPVQIVPAAPSVGTVMVVREADRTGTVAAGAAAATAPDLSALVGPYEAFVEGREALETLSLDALGRLRQTLSHALVVEPAFAAAHIVLANVLLLLYESTRADAQPDGAALDEAELHAREGCRLDQQSGSAWSTLGMVLQRRGARREAIADARKAVVLEAEDSRHWLRMAYVTWGGDRIVSGTRALSLNRGLALAHWFIAPVFVARGAFDHARHHLVEGMSHGRPR